MSLREVLKRWNVRTVGAAVEDGQVADGCRTTPSLLEELAADPADFADLARVLRLDLRAVIETLTADRAATPAELVSSLESRAEDEARLTRVREICAEVADRLGDQRRPREGHGEQPETVSSASPSWGERKEGGWGRWGGARVHRSATERTPAGAAS
jgi:hypothetical protein